MRMDSTPQFQGLVPQNNHPFEKDRVVISRSISSLFPHQFNGQIVHWMYPAFQSTIVMLLSHEPSLRFSTVVHATLDGIVLGTYNLISIPKTIKGSSVQSIMLRNDQIIFIDETKNDLSFSNSLKLTQWNLRSHQAISVPVCQYAVSCQMLGFPETSMFCVVKTKEIEMQRNYPLLASLQFRCFKFPLKPNDASYGIIVIDLQQHPRANPHLIKIRQLNYASLISIFNQEIKASSSKLEIQTFDCSKQHSNNQLTKHVIPYTNQQACSKQIVSVWQLRSNLWVISMKPANNKRNSQLCQFYLCNLKAHELISVIDLTEDIYNFLPQFCFHNRFLSESQMDKQQWSVFEENKKATMQNNIIRCFKIDILANAKNFKTVGTTHDDYFKFGLKISYPQYDPMLMILYEKGEKSKPVPYLLGNNPQETSKVEKTQDDWFKFEVKYIQDERLIQPDLIAMFLEQLISDCDDDLIRLSIEVTLKQSQPMWGF